jgi:flagellar biosynthesis/type III secretory pathway protein FliH
MSYRETVRLREPLRAVRIAYAGPPRLTEAEAAAREQAAREAGRKEAEQAASEAHDALRAELKQAQESFFEALNEEFGEAVETVNQRVPPVVMAVARRVLQGVELDATQLESLVRHAAGSVLAKGEAADVAVSPGALEQLKELEPGIQTRYPKLELRSDPDLGPNDVRVSSRFGQVDARVSTKLDKIEAELCG